MQGQLYVTEASQKSETQIQLNATWNITTEFVRTRNRSIHTYKLVLLHVMNKVNRHKLTCTMIQPWNRGSKLLRHPTTKSKKLKFWKLRNTMNLICFILIRHSSTPAHQHTSHTRQNCLTFHDTQHNITTALERKINLNFVTPDVGERQRDSEENTDLVRLVPCSQTTKRRRLVQEEQGGRVPCQKSGERERDVTRCHGTNARWHWPATVSVSS